MTNYSNPRMEAYIDNWPNGQHRVSAQFYVETTPRGERAVRMTKHPINNTWSQPVKITYAQRMRIVDGDDGRTYVARDHGAGMVSILRGDMKYQHEVAFVPRDPHAIGYSEARYFELIKLFDEGGHEQA